MGKVIVGMTMSLDGFVHDRDGSVSSLYPDLQELGQTEMMEESILTTGAVVMGRRAFEMGDPDSYAGNYEYQVPIFVLTHIPPEKHPKEEGNLTFTFITEGIESAVQEARAAAGEKNVVVVGGASTTQQCLKAGLVDELQVGIMPVLFGSGLRLFENIARLKLKLEKSRVVETGPRTDIFFKVIH